MIPNNYELILEKAKAYDEMIKEGETAAGIICRLKRRIEELENRLSICACCGIKLWRDR